MPGRLRLAILDKPRAVFLHEREEFGHRALLETAVVVLVHARGMRLHVLAETRGRVEEHLGRILLRTPHAVRRELHKLPFRTHPAADLRAVDVSAQHDRATLEEPREQRPTLLRVRRLPEEEPVRAPAVGRADGRVQHEKRVARARARVQHRVDLRRVRTHEVHEDEGVGAVVEEEVGARHGLADRLRGDGQDVGVERLVAAAADVVVAADGEERQVAESLRAGGLGVLEEAEMRLEVGAVALDEVAHLEEIGRVGTARAGGGGDQAREALRPHRLVARELALAVAPVVRMARLPLAVVEARGRGIEVRVAEDRD